MSSRKERMFRSYCRQLHGVGIEDTPIRDTPALLFVCAAQNAFKKGMRSTRKKKRRYALGGPHCENGRLKKHTHTRSSAGASIIGQFLLDICCLTRIRGRRPSSSAKSSTRFSTPLYSVSYTNQEAVDEEKNNIIVVTTRFNLDKMVE